MGKEIVQKTAGGWKADDQTVRNSADPREPNPKLTAGRAGEPLLHCGSLLHKARDLVASGSTGGGGDEGSLQSLPKMLKKYLEGPN